MKYLLAYNFALLLTIVSAKLDFFEEVTAFDYHRKVGIPLVVQMKSMENIDQTRFPGIVGGSIIDIKQVPYQAGLIVTLPLGLVSVCGGTVISNTRVMTAAHCVRDGVMTARSFTVVLGSNRIFKGGKRIETNEFVIHPDWNPFNAANDIAIISMPAVTFSNVIQPVNLPNEHQFYTSFVGWTALASGYGRTGGKATFKTDVKIVLEGKIRKNQAISAVNLTVIHNNECEFVYGTEYVRDSNICTSGTDGRGTCNGDSGGPLVVTIDYTRVVIGITSFGAKAGCEAGYPAAYTRVSSYIRWILSI